MASRRSGGIAGSAVLVGTAGLYLVYVGVKDVPFFDGLRSLLRRQQPTPKQQHAAYVGKEIGLAIATGMAPAAGDTGIDRLVGNAKAAYPAIRAVAPGKIGGWGLRADMSSDHPKGLAMDVMTTDPAVAKRIIGVFRGQTGAKYWIWNRQIANVAVNNWQPRPYSGPSPHTDHVHLSYS